MKWRENLVAIAMLTLIGVIFFFVVQPFTYSLREHSKRFDTDPVKKNAARDTLTYPVTVQKR